MPTKSSISAESAGVYLPGTRVTCIHRGKEVGICIVPSHAALAAAHKDNDIYVCWPNGDAEWVEDSFVRRVTR